MASFVEWKKDQKIIDLATVNGVAGVNAAIGGTDDWDIYTIPEGAKWGTIQVCQATGFSTSFLTVGFKVLAGIDGTNWFSLFSTSAVNSLGSGSLNTFFLPSLLNHFRFIKLSNGSVSYGACDASATKGNSFHVKFFCVKA